ncbi:hypothetical protein ACOSP7_019460 [Xanthoceras sorbifolium]
MVVSFRLNMRIWVLFALKCRRYDHSKEGCTVDLTQHIEKKNLSKGREQGEEVVDTNPYEPWLHASYNKNNIFGTGRRPGNNLYVNEKNANNEESIGLKNPTSKTKTIGSTSKNASDTFWGSRFEALREIMEDMAGYTCDKHRDMAEKQTNVNTGNKGALAEITNLGILPKHTKAHAVKAARTGGKFTKNANNSQPAITFSRKSTLPNK